MASLTPETDKLYALAVYDMPYDTSYGSFNYKAWETIRLLKKHMERFEKERNEALDKNKPQ